MTARPRLTRELAQAASFDAANRTMRAGGRTTWNEDDAHVAYLEFERLWPRCPHNLEPEDVCRMCDQGMIPAIDPRTKKAAPKRRPAVDDPTINVASSPANLRI